MRPRNTGVVSGVFALGYGALRFVTEHFREPDAHLGYLLGGWLTMGQVLSLPLVIIGILLIFYGNRASGPQNGPNNGPHKKANAT